VSERILVFDVGATSIKSGVLNESGNPLANVARRSTPYPCTPATLLQALALRVAISSPTKLAVGFPGVLSNDLVVDAGNLTRPEGPSSPPSTELIAQWRDFALRERLEGAFSCTARVVNDAAMAALGCAGDEACEIVVTLGTGCGFALAHHGRLVETIDVGSALFEAGISFDEAVGEAARRRDEPAWRDVVVAVVRELASSYGADVVHLAGGNAQRLSPTWFGDLSDRVVIEGNAVALLGGVRLFYPRASAGPV